MTDLVWTPASDDDPEFTITTASLHSVLAGRSAAGAHPATALTYDPTVSGLTGDTVQEAIDELEAGKVPTARTITAGTGLTGGGDLSANRTLTVAYGTGAGTSAQGNDSRLSDARTPTAHEASHHHDGSDPLDAGDVGAVPVESVGLLPGERNRGTWDVAATYAVGDVVAASGSVYVASSPSTGLDPASNPGSWDEIVDFLDRRIELGTGSSATGDGSTAIGTISSATGDASTAIGTISSATGVGSTAIGYGSSATGDVSTAVGAYSSATTDGEVNLANIYRGSVDPGDPTVATGAEIATGFVDLPETSVVTDPAADHQRLIARTDGLYVRDQTGTEVGPLGRHGLTVPLPSAIGFHRRIGSNVAMGRGTVWWIRIPEIAHDAKVTHVWIDTVTGIASCTATGAIVSTTTAGKPGTVLASTAVDAIDMSVSAAVNGAALSSPYTLTTGGNYWVAVLALGGASDPAVRGADGVESWLNVKVGTAPVTPAGGNTYGCLRLTGQASIPGTPAATVGTGTPVVYLSVEAP